MPRPITVICVTPRNVDKSHELTFKARRSCATSRARQATVTSQSSSTSRANAWRSSSPSTPRATRTSSITWQTTWPWRSCCTFNTWRASTARRSYILHVNINVLFSVNRLTLLFIFIDNYILYQLLYSCWATSLSVCLMSAYSGLSLLSTLEYSTMYKMFEQKSLGNIHAQWRQCRVKSVHARRPKVICI